MTGTDFRSFSFVEAARLHPFHKRGKKSECLAFLIMTVGESQTDQRDATDYKTTHRKPVVCFCELENGGTRSVVTAKQTKKMLKTRRRLIKVKTWFIYCLYLYSDLYRIINVSAFLLTDRSFIIHKSSLLQCSAVHLFIAYTYRDSLKCRADTVFKLSVLCCCCCCCCCSLFFFLFFPRSPCWNSKFTQCPVT